MKETINRASARRLRSTSTMINHVNGGVMKRALYHCGHPPQNTQHQANHEKEKKSENPSERTFCKILDQYSLKLSRSPTKKKKKRNVQETVIDKRSLRRHDKCNVLPLVVTKYHTLCT